MNQGDVYWYTFRAPDKRRPVLILTRSSAIPFLTGITVAAITTTNCVTPTLIIFQHEYTGNKAAEIIPHNASGLPL